ncbi:MAG TPA: TMEM175 family protein [Bacteroidia bacterium]|nr:TMEM175 family protein [Bacteroidia bacterium]
MGKGRLEAFSDGVLAIIITIMVLEIKVPHGAGWNDLFALFPVFVSYIMSFAYIGIYWGNHHHLMHTAKHVDGKIILANLHLLFWLSLIPFTTGWMGENHFEPNPVALHATNLLISGFAYFILQKVIEKSTPADEKLGHAFRKHTQKGIISQVAYASAIPLAYVHPAISGAIFIFIAVLWILPDKEIEQALK